MTNDPSKPAGVTAPRDRQLPEPPSAEYARDALRLNGITLSEEDLALTAAEFGRALEIIAPLLDYPLPDALDQAGVYRP